MSKSKKRLSPLDPKGPTLSPSKKRNFSSYYRHLIAVGLIAGVAFVVYSNTFSVPFLFDDRPNITLNPNVQIKVLTWDRIETLIKYTYRESIRVFAYFTFALNYYFGGLDVFGYHLVNFIIHVFSGIFLYGFLYLTFNLPSLREKYGALSYKVALFASLIFIAHPIQTQSVTYIVQRMASMGGMFYILCMVLYVKGRLAGGKDRYAYFAGLGVAYLLGVFTKENVAILPLMIALYEFYFIQHFDLSPRGRKILFTLIGVLLFLGTLVLVLWGKRYLQVIIEGYAFRTFTMEERLFTQSRVVLYYLSLLLYPHPSRLTLDYDFPISKSLFDPVTTLFSIMVIAGLVGTSVWVAKKRPLLSYCILWYFVNLVIESSIFPLEMVYEHRLYIPSVGPFILFGLGILRGLEKMGPLVSSVKALKARPEASR